MNVRTGKHLVAALALAGWAAVPFSAAHAADKAKPVGSDCAAEFSSAECRSKEPSVSVPGGGGFGSGSSAPTPAPQNDPFNCGANPQNCLPAAGNKTKAPSTREVNVPSDPRAKATARAGALRMRQECQRKYHNDAQALKECLSNTSY